MELTRISKKDWFDYISVFFMIGYSGITFFTQNRIIYLLIIGLYTLRFLRKPQFNKFFLIVFIFQLLISIVQFIQLGNFNILSWVGNFLIWYFPYLIYLETKEKFIPIFIDLMKKFIILSLIIWLILIFYPELNTILKSISKLLLLDPESNESLIFYNVEFHRLFGFAFRNAGPFNESGTFGVMIILTFMLNLIYSGIEKIYSKANLIFIFAIITTGSTGAYIALGSFLTLYYSLIIRKFNAILILPMVLVVNIYAFNHIEFLKNKVEMQSTTQFEESKLYNRGRFGTALADLEITKKYPIGGVGIYKENRIYDKGDKEHGKQSSLMAIPGILARYGIPFSIFYLFFLLFAFRRLSLKNGLNSWLYPMIFYTILQITWMGQAPFVQPVFVLLLYTGLEYWLVKPRQLHLKSL